MAQLTPRVATTSGSYDYFSSPLPLWSTLQSGLALFGLVVILRFCSRRIHSSFDRWTHQSQQSHHLDKSRANDGLENPRDQAQYFSPPDSAMAESQRTRSLVGPRTQRLSLKETGPVARQQEGYPPQLKWNTSLDSARQPVLSRPPPAPPLTPPELSTTVFTYDDSARSQRHYTHQPNPDYASASSTASTSQSGSASPLTPRRRSYNKTLPIGIPVSRPQSASEAEYAADLTVPSSSYPPTSPLLPPPPPGWLLLAEEEEEDEDEAKPRSIDVHGEIITVLDGDRAGWSRHTRVYGGGACLACAASGEGHGGGFYGATVRPEEMR